MKRKKYTNEKMTSSSEKSLSIRSSLLDFSQLPDGEPGSARPGGRTHLRMSLGWFGPDHPHGVNRHSGGNGEIPAISSVLVDGIGRLPGAAVRSVSHPTGQETGQGADEDQVEDDLRGHQAAGELPDRVDVAVADGRHGDDGEVQGVESGVDAGHLVTARLGQHVVRGREGHDDDLVQEQQALDPYDPTD